MVRDSTLLRVCESFVIGVASLESFPSVELTRLLSVSGKITIKSLAAAATLLLADIVIVSPTSDEHTTEEES